MSHSGPITRRPWFTSVAIALTLIIALAAIAVAFTFQGQTIDSLQARVDRGVSLYDRKSVDYDKLLNNYKQLTKDCLVAADCTTETPSPTQIQAQATAPVNGENGINGTNGRDATPDAIFTQVEKYCSLVICVGPSGQNGADGQTVVGPAGPAGADGAPGAPGATGATGADGQPPYSWTYADGLGLEHTCSRTDPFDPAAPTYACS